MDSELDLSGELDLSDEELDFSDEELDLLEEPLGPFRFSVWQPEPQLFGPPQIRVFSPPQTLSDLSQVNNQFDVIFQSCVNANGDELDSVRIHRFLFDRTDFLSFANMEMTLGLLLRLLRLSEPGIQQIFHHIHSQAQAIANHERNSNQSIIPLSLFLECFGVANHHAYDLVAARVMELEHSVYEYVSTYNPVPATKSSIEALEKVRLEDASFASKEPCMICMEHLSSMVEVTRMPCSHLYHGDCIVQWLNTSHLCPLCRFPMPCENP